MVVARAAIQEVALPMRVVSGGRSGGHRPGFRETIDLLTVVSITRKKNSSVWKYDL